MEKTVYITEKEREMCYKVIDAFAELYEMEDEDILLVLGKGHEEVILFRDQRIPFNDKQEILKYLEQIKIHND